MNMASGASANQPHGPDLREELREYYQPILPYFEPSLVDRGDLDLWRALAKEHRGAAVLELGAGTGRVTRVLAGPAGTAVALDLNLEMLRRAGPGLARRGAHRVVADMRSFELAEEFELIVAPNDPFSHLRKASDRDRALRQAARHLAPGGRLVLDTLWLPGDELAEAAGPGGRLVERTASTERGPLQIRARWRCDVPRRRCDIDYAYLEEGEVVARSVFRGRYWTREEVERRFRRAGLEVRRLWGGYDRSPWRPDAACLVVDARRS